MQTTAGTYGQIYFTTSSDTPWGFNDTESISFTLIPDGQFHTYVLDMSTIAGWKGTIKELRLDPGDTPATFDIDYIRIMKQ